MKEFLIAQDICQILKHRSHTAVIAGGAVRDIILGRDPHDFDVATSAASVDVIRVLTEHGFEAKKVGTVCDVVIATKGHIMTEIATFREDGPHSDGRRPDFVIHSDMKTDAFRRDLTVNSMFMDPDTMEVFDFVGGRADLEAGIIRMVGNAHERIAEDKLRMLRVIRFAVKFGFKVHPDTLSAVQAHAKDIRVLPVERIRDELDKTLVLGNSALWFELMMKTHLMHEVLPEIAVLEDTHQSPNHHPEGNVAIHTALVMSHVSGHRLRWAALLHDVGKPAAHKFEDGRHKFHGHDDVGAEIAEKILSRLKFSNDDVKSILFLVKNHMRIHQADQMKNATIRKLRAEEFFDDLVQLGVADCLGSNKDLSSIEFLQKKLEEFDHLPIKPVPLITGRDLIDLGLKPGPRFAHVLSAMMDRQLEQEFTTREEGLKLLMEVI
jgi:poly(A) polymerase